MKNIILYPVFVFCCLALPRMAQAQVLEVDGSYSAAELVMDFFDGACVDVLTVEYFGADGQKAYFEYAPDHLGGVHAGILLATGDAGVAVGPNDQDGASQGYGNNTPDSVLAMLSGNSGVFDRALLHLMLRPYTDTLGFKYVFASEEYCEYVGSNFNDAFGFFIQGPGISGPFPGNVANIAQVDTGVYVTINNVNHLAYSNLYINNTPSTSTLCDQNPSTSNAVFEIQFDGFTTALQAGTAVMSDSIYEVWIVVADIGDGIFDSGIFLSVESLCGDSLLSPVAGFIAQPNGNTVTFDNPTKYATAWHWDFGDGATSTERYPTHTYADLSQVYTVTLIATNYCCADTVYALVGGASAVSEARPLDVQVYPSSFRDRLTVEPADAALSGELTLTDLAGRVALRQAFAGRTVLPTERLAAGTYLLEICTRDQQRLVRKVTRL